MNKNRFFITALIFIITVVITIFPVSAQNYGDFSLVLPDGYKSALKDEDKSHIADIVGMETDDLNNYFEVNSIEFFAVNSDNTSQIKLSVTEDDFSKKIVSFNNLDDKKITQLANSFFTASYKEVNEGVLIVKQNNCKFLKYEENLKDSGGEYTVTQFVTVNKGKTYILSVLYPKTDIGLADEFFNSFKLSNRDNNLNTVNKIIIIFAVFVFSVIIIFTLINIFKVYKKDSDTTHTIQENA